jgi:hypothetical protein
MTTIPADLRKLLQWLDQASPLLESQVVESGLSRALDKALMRGFAEMGAHPTARERDMPAASVSITGAGRAALYR